MRYYLLAALLLLSLPGYAATIYFPQVADGEGLQTTITVSNPGGNATTGTLRFFSPGGAPWPLSVNSTVNSTFPITIPAHGSARFATSGAGSIATGWASVESVEVLSGVASFEVRSQDTLAQTLGVLGAAAARQFMIPADYSSRSDVGIALINTSASRTLNVDLSLVDESGVVIQTSTDTAYKNIPAHGYVTKYISEAFPNIPSDFKGSLVGEVSGTGAMAVLGLTQTEGLYSAIPVDNPSLAVAKRMLGEWQFTPYVPNWGTDQWEPAISFRAIEEDRNNPGQFYAWGDVDYVGGVTRVYWDKTRQSYVGLSGAEAWDYNDVYIFNFTSDTTIEGCYHYLEPYFADPLNHLGTCYDLTGTRTDR